MANIIKFPSQSEQDKKEFESIKELEYTSYDVNNIYLHWGKNRGLRAEVEPIGIDKLILKVNENGDRAWTYIKDMYGVEHKYILDPQFCLLISDDLDQLIDAGIYKLYYNYIEYIMYIHMKKVIDHHKDDYKKYVYKRFMERCEEEEYYIKNKDSIIDIINSPLIEKFD